ncbi:MAG TPA: precorrin-3B C(17)-methyltransferase [Acidimicrobiales bacterium]|nr:precorrin-3B C(17)-methyltransferase [Acidimicrobiales bacterium]
MTVVTISVTEAGAALAQRLPYRHEHGDLGDRVRRLWPEVDGLVLVCATGIAVRVIAPLLGDKHDDPAVVCVDDGGRWAIALAGGHHGANALATEVASLLGAEAVVTTATDLAALPALDTLPGFRFAGDVAAVSRAWLDGHPPTVDASDLPHWPLPPALTSSASLGGPGGPGGTVVVTDRVVPEAAGTVVLQPESLVVGVGSSSGAEAGGIAELLAGALAEAGLSRAAVGLVASVDLKRGEPGIVALAAELGVELRTFPADVLAGQDVPTPSDVVAQAVGTPSVAEAAALVAAGPGAQLVVPKRRSSEATVAIARRRRPEGHLAVVGLGPGDAAFRAPAAAAAVRRAEVVIGYDLYVDLASDLLAPHHEVVRSPIGAEADRCHDALRRAAEGRHVALVCSGDPGVFAMASLVCELAPHHGNPPLTIVPGVTAAHAAAAVLGAPLGHDHAAVSLSDLLTPWEVIERRVQAVAEGDMVVSFYNPRSQRRTWQLPRALEILARHRPPACPAAVVTDVGRTGKEHVLRTTVAELDPTSVGMLSLVVVGSSTTRWIGSRMVTPRGYKAAPEPAP